MGRHISDTGRASGAIVPSADMPISGRFGTGNIRIFGSAGAHAFEIPSNSVRVRLWGGGANAGYNAALQKTGGGAGGGFALKVLNGLTVGQVVTVTVAAPGGTSSFGSYVSATGGVTAGAGGVGIGGDINTKGGSCEGLTCPGGCGAGSLFGDGAGSTGSASGLSGASGAGAATPGGLGGSGISGVGGTITSTSQTSYFCASGPAAVGHAGLDYLGTGGGGVGGNPYGGPGSNGGGGGFGAAAGPSCGGVGGWPGGGGGMCGGSAGGGIILGHGANGLVIVEW